MKPYADEAINLAEFKMPDPTCFGPRCRAALYPLRGHVANRLTASSCLIIPSIQQAAWADRR